ncbi:flagellar hook capping FlgD N-terminal domain-containing protein [Clostridium sp.]|uniref:flagellar hook capping FlgD N-terminal domain-containing protein n=1 Tax=Clostridium sp. TaxID=1506 RepID=UPI0026075049|nr:flagellar hook capping FlgD N-terminal domain-containing protein [uncultured Clostridium sp.]
MANDVTAASNTDKASLASATNRGTAIVKKDAAIDQNSFLKILSAELTNQDPTNAKDGTEFVAQMAQFASMEQMNNLNSTMSFSSSASLVGKLVAFSSYDDKGVQYGGTVQAVYKDSGSTYIAVKLADGSTKDFPADTLSDVIDSADTIPSSSNVNTTFSSAISLMSKQVDTVALSDGKVYSGTVTSVSKDSTGTKLTITYKENGVDVTKDISYDDISKVE